jgi:hypothetical protein
MKVALFTNREGLVWASLSFQTQRNPPSQCAAHFRLFNLATETYHSLLLSSFQARVFPIFVRRRESMG